MDLAYKYIAKTESGQTLTGVTFGPSKALAGARLKKIGFRPTSLQLALGATLGSWVSPDFDAAQLARFYRTIGRRLERSKPLAEGLEAALEYINDERLRGAILVFRQCVQDGQTQHQGLVAAGFPRRDAMVIRSTEQAGSTGKAYLSLAAEVERTYQLRRSIKSVFYLPAAMAVFMIFFVWAALSYITPLTMSFLKQTGSSRGLNPAIEMYFSFARHFNESHTLSSVLYFGAFLGLAVFLRSDVFRKQLDRIPFLRKMSEKGDHATLWSNFALLYDAAVPAKDAARIVADAASRSDSRQAFVKMGRLLEGGRDLGEAASLAGFPSFVGAGVRAAVSGGDLKDGLHDMTAGLEDDVTTLAGMLKENVKIGSTIAVALGVFMVFLVTYYPILASILSQF